MSTSEELIGLTCPPARHRLAQVAVALFVAALSLSLASCTGTVDPAEQRLELAKSASADVVIGAAWPWSKRAEGMYGKGIDLAVREVNASGGVLGRTVRIKRADDNESIVDGRLVAQRMIEDPNVFAVIGHLNSHVSIPVARMYDEGGLLMLTPASTSPELTEQGLRRVFRSVNNDRAVGSHMVRYAKSQGYERIVIGYVRNAYGLGLANAFEFDGTRSGLNVVDRRGYDAASGDARPNFDPIVNDWANLDVDAVFLAGMAPDAAYLVRELRDAGIDAPIFGGDALNTHELIEVAGSAAEGMVVASVFHPDNPRPTVQTFNEAFRAEYGVRPNSWAARGYEAVRLLTHAMQRAGSVVPDRVADEMRSFDGWSGVTGTFVFDDRGDVVGKEVMTVEVRSERFEFRGEQHLVSSQYLERNSPRDPSQWVNTTVAPE